MHIVVYGIFHTDMIKLYPYKYVLSAIVTMIIALVSCNTDNDLNSNGTKPTILPDSEYGIYTVKVGNELLIEPTFKDLGSGTVRWIIDGETVHTGLSWSHIWDKEGIYYVTIEAENSAGKTTSEIRVDVVDLTPPIISLMIPEGGIFLLPDQEYTFSPSIQHNSPDDGFTIRWYVNGQEKAQTEKFTFKGEATGIYHIIVEAANNDGTTKREFEINVSETLPCSVAFISPMFTRTTDERYTLPGRPVCLQTYTEYFSNAAFSWKVLPDDGVTIKKSTDGQMATVTMSHAGRYTVTVTAEETITGRKHTASAAITINCLTGSELTYMRPATSASSPYSTTVYEYIPAPGQFINDTRGDAGMTGAETVPAAASAWAQGRLALQRYVSLGAFGGHIIVGFDHSIMAGSAEYDILIGGNAIRSTIGGSNEPGIVWVMQDINGNGLPDDEWYRLKGSDDNSPGAVTDYCVTYYRPASPHTYTLWSDNMGNSGQVDYCGAYHSQPFYYPLWIAQECYTLHGFLLPPNNSLDAVTGMWNNAAYGWGYADNMGSDSFSADPETGAGQRNGFRISNAVCADGTPVELKYIDFIKVQTGVMAKSGPLGEVSTEVTFFRDNSM